MEYRKHYNLLIEKARSSPKLEGEYYENHHVIPRSLGGTDAQDNLVSLTFRQHYVAHHLLYKIYQYVDLAQAYKLGCAFFLMSKSNNGTRNTNSRLYDQAKRCFAEAQKLFNQTEEGQVFRKKIAKARVDNQKVQFVYHFYHEAYGDFMISTTDLMNMFPEQKLNSSNLVKVGKGERPSTKGWMLYENRKLGIEGLLQLKREKMSISAKKRYRGNQ